MRLVVLLCQAKFLRLERYQVLVSILIELGEDSRVAPLRGISLQSCQESQVVVTQQRRSREAIAELALRLYCSIRLLQRLCALPLIRSFKEVSNRLGYNREPFNKPLIEVSKANKDLDVLNCRQGRLIYNCFYPLRIYRNAVKAHNKPQELNLSYCKGAFLKVNKQVVLSQPIKHPTHILLVVFFQFREDKDIVQVDYAEYINKASQGLVNISLEGSRCVSKAKRHN